MLALAQRVSQIWAETDVFVKTRDKTPGWPPGPADRVPFATPRLESIAPSGALARAVAQASRATAEGLVRARPHCRNRAQPIGFGSLPRQRARRFKDASEDAVRPLFRQQLEMRDKGEFILVHAWINLHPLRQRLARWLWCPNRLRINGHLGRQKCEIRDRPHVVHRLSSLTPNSAHSQLKS